MHLISFSLSVMCFSLVMKIDERIIMSYCQDDPDVSYQDKRDKIQKLVTLLQDNKWREVLSEYDRDDGFHESLLVWIRKSFTRAVD